MHPRYTRLQPILYRCYMFQCHLPHPYGALHKDLSLTKLYVECIKIYIKYSRKTALFLSNAYLGFTSKYTLDRLHVSAFALGHLQVQR
jgi:hypothetical protein